MHERDVNLRKKLMPTSKTEVKTKYEAELKINLHPN